MYSEVCFDFLHIVCTNFGSDCKPRRNVQFSFELLHLNASTQTNEEKNFKIRVAVWFFSYCFAARLFLWVVIWIAGMLARVPWTMVAVRSFPGRHCLPSTTWDSHPSEPCVQFSGQERWGVFLFLALYYRSPVSIERERETTGHSHRILAVFLYWWSLKLVDANLIYFDFM